MLDGFTTTLSTTLKNLQEEARVKHKTQLLLHANRKSLPASRNHHHHLHGEDCDCGVPLDSDSEEDAIGSCACGFCHHSTSSSQSSAEAPISPTSALPSSSTTTLPSASNGPQPSEATGLYSTFVLSCVYKIALLSYSKYLFMVYSNSG